MSIIDLSILKETPRLTVSAELRIEPLAPLSMIEELPGSFYKTLKKPSQKMICGIIENVLGWHVDWKDRKILQEEIKKLRRKKRNEYVSRVSGSTYIPLLMDFFEITDEIQIDFSEICFFDDLWSRSYRRADAVVHPNGTENIDYRFIPLKWKLKRDEKDSQKVDAKSMESFFKKNIGNFPMYYTTPTSREYIDLKGTYRVPLLMDEKLYVMLRDGIEINNIGYLGNSEGWINLKIVAL